MLLPSFLSGNTCTLPCFRQLLTYLDLVPPVQLGTPGDELSPSGTITGINSHFILGPGDAQIIDNGTYERGICVCNDGYYGDCCQCDETSISSENLLIVINRTL